MTRAALSPGPNGCIRPSWTNLAAIHVVSVTMSAPIGSPASSASRTESTYSSLSSITSS